MFEPSLRFTKATFFWSRTVRTHPLRCTSVPTQALASAEWPVMSSTRVFFRHSGICERVWPNASQSDKPRAEAETGMQLESIITAKQACTLMKYARMTASCPQWSRGQDCEP